MIGADFLAVLIILILERKRRETFLCRMCWYFNIIITKSALNSW